MYIKRVRPKANPLYILSNTLMIPLHCAHVNNIILDYYRVYLAGIIISMKKFSTIDEYIADCPMNIRATLEELRQTIHQIAPEAHEKISYGLATFTFHGNLVHFGGYETHIGLYPGAAPVAEFKKELEPYETSKGTIRFPIDKPLPFDLIRKIVKSAMQRNLERNKK